MILRPVDQNGDVLPVLSSASMLRGVQAEKGLVTDRLDLLSGDWWENPAWGNAVVDLLKENRYTEADMQAIANYLTSYIGQTPGVAEVKDVTFFMDAERSFVYQCTVVTENGDIDINHML